MTDTHTLSPAQCRRALLLPLTIGLALLLTIFVAAAAWHQRQSIDASRERTVTAVNEAFDVAIRRDSDKLGAALKIIAHDERLRTTFTQGNREALLARTAALFSALRRDHDITHFYFIDTERRMFLRVQRPESHGDLVQRTTLLRAEQTGQTAQGLELGQKGVFTLRVVEPWRDESGTLVGYIELGMEIDRTLVQLHELTGVDLYLLVDKRHLDRRQWEDGMAMINHEKNWDLLPTHVLAGRTRNATELLLASHPAASVTKGTFDGRQRVTTAERTVEFVSLPLLDAAGRSVGAVLLAHDLTATEARHERFLAIVATAAILVGLALLALGARAINRVHARLTQRPPHREAPVGLECPESSAP